MASWPDETPQNGETAHSRARAGRTKRERSRTVLLEAAGRVFAKRGWQGTRVEHIAHEAGLGVTTIYAHFPSKQALLACVYAPVMQSLFEHAGEDLAQERPAVQAVRRHISELVGLARQHQALTIPFLESVTEATLRTNGTVVGDDDPRRIVPLATPLSQLVAAGQRRGELKPFPTAGDIGAFITDIALLRVFTRPHESVEDTSVLALACLLCTVGLAQTP